MNLRPIKSKRGYLDMILWVEVMMTKKVRLNSPMGQKIRIALKLIKRYEDIRIKATSKE